MDKLGEMRSFLIAYREIHQHKVQVQALSLEDAKQRFIDGTCDVKSISSENIGLSSDDDIDVEEMSS